MEFICILFMKGGHKMKNIVPIIVFCLFMLNGLNEVATSNNFENTSSLESAGQKIHIVPIVPSDAQVHHIKNYFVTYNNDNAGNCKVRIKQQHSNEMTSALDTFNYVMITTEDLFNAITSSTFVEWKELIGFNVKIVNITDSEISSQSGRDVPEKIRTFLRSYYETWGIEFVLIVGNHATIPMKYCYPDPANHRFDIFDYTSGEVPTDYYYADLSSSDSTSWDLDGDGYYGEYGEDAPDFSPEVYVGRIPTNVNSRITYTLDKIVTFEQDAGTWKENALNAGAFFYFTNEEGTGNPAMDGAKLSYYIENDIMNNWTISHYSEQEGLEKSVYPWPALTEAAFISDWRNGKYSIVNWQGHGWTTRVARKVWISDNGNDIPEESEMSWPDFININSYLDDDFPSIVTAESCYVGCPEPATGGNLGIDLLTDPSLGASIGVVASARSPYGSFDWPSDPGGSDSILYEFNRLMIHDAEKVGEALYDSKYFCNYYYGWAHWAEYLDMYTFNLYGDPSLTLQGVPIENLPPDKPTIEGPTRGNPGNEYDYCIVATDPDGDQLLVRFDWGDGTGSEWLGPVLSGTEVCDSHTWDEKGAYQLSVTVEDEHGLRVTAYKEVSFPKTRLITMFLERVLEHYPFDFFLFTCW